ncbi:MAG: hypothetical protein QOH81_3366 [Sphingomonadales bacterium]|jgi:hypothetical protein|nr:hypothetical protein [Sphingomonadales bacterium]
MKIAFLLPALALFAGCASAPQPADRRMGPRAGPERHRGFYISAMGEPFRSQEGGPPPAMAWFSNADADRDGAISLAEMEADASRFFATLDVNHDGEIDPAEITRYEEVVAPELHQLGRFGGGGGGGGGGAGRGGGGGMGRGGGGGMGRGGGGGMGRGGGGGGGMGGGGGGRGGHGGGDRSGGAAEGGGRPAAGRPEGRVAGGLLNLPEPVTAADADMNRGVSAAEFRRAADQRFLLLDVNRDGKLAPDEIRPRRPGEP